jgi:hypothetical protein
MIHNKTAKNYGDPGYSAYADGGSEPAFTTWTGRRVQYVWMPRTGEHAYLDLGTDMIMSEEEVGYHVYREGAPAARSTYRYPAPRRSR